MAKFINSLLHKLTAMSHDDSLDDETKQLLKAIQDKETHSDDSKESDKFKEEIKEHEKQPYQIKDEDIKWETNTEDTPDDEW